MNALAVQVGRCWWGGRVVDVECMAVEAQAKCHTIKAAEARIPTPKVRPAERNTVSNSMATRSFAVGTRCQSGAQIQDSKKKTNTATPTLAASAAFGRAGVPGCRSATVAEALMSACASEASVAWQRMTPCPCTTHTPTAPFGPTLWPSAHLNT